MTFKKQSTESGCTLILLSCMSGTPCRCQLISLQSILYTVKLFIFFICVRERINEHRPQTRFESSANINKKLIVVKLGRVSININCERLGYFISHLLYFLTNDDDDDWASFFYLCHVTVCVLLMQFSPSLNVIDTNI